MSEARYAIYYAPAHGSPLDRFGAAVLGYDAYTGDSVRHAEIPGASLDSLHKFTEAPRVYGFHATLKAPFRLAPGRSEAGLVDALDEFARVLAPVPIGQLRVTALGSFIGLTPARASSALQLLAAECVTSFDAFRAPMTDQELARRRPETLNRRERALLERWGYPHVFERFRFHMSLTGSLVELDRALWLERLERFFARMAPDPVIIEGLSLFRQEAPTAPFRIIGRHALRGKGTD